MTLPTPTARFGASSAAAVACLALLAGCSGDSATDSSTEPSPTASPSSSVAGSPSGSPTERATAEPAPRPEEGACYSLGYDAAVAPTSDVTPSACEEGHTARTFAVGTLDLVADGHLLAVDSQRAQQQPAERCPERLGEFLGGDADAVRLSVFRAVWFSPTVEESDGGADWFRCDVIALSRNEELAPLDGRLAGVLDRPDDASRWRLCGTAEPGTDGFERVACSQDDSWRAISVVDLGDGDYPGRDAAAGAGDGTCEDAARDAAEDPLNFRWGYEWPSREQWRAGQQYGLCWTPG